MTKLIAIIDDSTTITFYNFFFFDYLKVIFIALNSNFFLVLLFPAFNPNAISAHFDSKIAEHVAHVIDTVAQMNLTQLTTTISTTTPTTTTKFNSNSNILNHNNFNEDLRAQIIDYIRKFARRLPTPFLLESSAGGLQFKTWEWTWQENEDKNNRRLVRENENEDEYTNVDNSQEGIPDKMNLEINDGHSVVLNNRCYIRLPKLKHKCNFFFKFLRILFLSKVNRIF